MGKASDNKAFMLIDSNVSYDTTQSANIAILANGKGSNAPDIYYSSDSSTTETSYETVTIEQSFTFGGDVQKLMLYKRTVLYDTVAAKNVNWDGHFITIHKDGTLTYNNSQYGNAPYEKTIKADSDLVNKSGWNRVAVTIYPDELKYSMYLNGVKIINKEWINGAYTDPSAYRYAGMNWMGPRIMYAALKNPDIARKSTVAVDNVCWYEGEYYDNPQNAVNMTINGFSVDENNIIIPSGKKVSEVLSAIDTNGGQARIFKDDTFGKLLDNDANISAGNVLVATSPNELTYEYYNILSGTDLGKFNYTVDGYHTDGKFKTGLFKADVKIKTYESTAPAYVFAAAQYKNGALEKLDTDVLTGTEDTSLDVELDITETENTEIKLMLWDALGNMLPIKAAELLTPFSSQQIETVQEMFPGHTAKAVTFSYDDGPLEDATLISIFDNAGVKGTFNIISDKFKYSIKPYQNHEVASHSMAHPFFSAYIPDKYDKDVYQVLSLDEVKAEISGAKAALEEKFGCEVPGLAYPFNGLDSRTAAEKQELKEYMEEVGVEYARVITYRDDYYIPTDWYEWEPTCHHNNMGKYIDEFLAFPADGDLKLFSIWGHSHEFRSSENYGWDYIEEMINRFKDVDDVWKATNIEVCRYSKALDNIVVDYESNTITNPSKVDIYLYVNGEKVIVPAEGFIIGTGK